ncbi:hypothetical protein BRADI_5g08913v3 [Brachypodium distachyon]|uniref:Uncharacterized protein n=1 Tax=Brachypodium distachyon TaxID=15368 RepID=A0A2K2CG51_BRADI|nr:hypothetical protein BRADI_5g08913v3 [Brachypodium distachyon]
MLGSYRQLPIFSWTQEKRNMCEREDYVWQHSLPNANIPWPRRTRGAWHDAPAAVGTSTSRQASPMSRAAPFACDACSLAVNGMAPQGIYLSIDRKIPPLKTLHHAVACVVSLSRPACRLDRPATPNPPTAKAAWLTLRISSLWVGHCCLVGGWPLTNGKALAEQSTHRHYHN